MNAIASPAQRLPFELRFAPARASGSAYVFPCDAGGGVDLDALPERARVDYFFARSLVGRDVLRPVVIPIAFA